MTNEQLFDDMKQFFQAEISQAVAGLASKEDLARLEATMATKEDLAGEISGLRAEMLSRYDELVDGVNQQTETILAAIESSERHQTVRLDDHETRITRLERHAA